MPAIHPARDLEGVRKALDELLVELMETPEVDRAIRRARESLTETDELVKVEKPRSLSTGYYDWAAYLVWLEGMVQTPGVSFQLLAVEAEGLQLVRAARMEFDEKYPQCPRCGKRNRRFSECSDIACRKG